MFEDVVQIRYMFNGSYSYYSAYQQDSIENVKKGISDITGAPLESIKIKVDLEEVKEGLVCDYAMKNSFWTACSFFRDIEVVINCQQKNESCTCRHLVFPGLPDSMKFIINKYRQLIKEKYGLSVDESTGLEANPFLLYKEPIEVDRIVFNVVLGGEYVVRPNKFGIPSRPTYGDMGDMGYSGNEIKLFAKSSSDIDSAMKKRFGNSLAYKVEEHEIIVDDQELWYYNKSRTSFSQV